LEIEDDMDALTYCGLNGHRGTGWRYQGNE
jgi:hypothetical protein